MYLRMPLLLLSPLLPRPRPPCRLLPPLLRQLRPIHLHLCRHLLPAFVAVRIGVLFLALHRRPCSSPAEAPLRTPFAIALNY